METGKGQHPESGEARRERKRRQIMDIARDIFLRDGYAGASMSEISAQVGGSKGTLYAYFASKSDLFRAMLEDFLARHEAEVSGTIAGGGAPGEVLRAFSERFLEVLLRSENLALMRLVYAEAGRFPEVGQAFYDSGPANAEQHLAVYIRGAVEEGYLRADTDPVLAARQMILLSQGWIHNRRLWNVTPAPSDTEIRENAHAAVRTFLAAFGA